MWKWLASFFTPSTAMQVRLLRNIPEIRSSHCYERLTAFECELMRKNGLRCPDCNGPLLQGPEGGMSMNAACKHCHSEFNLTVFAYQTDPPLIHGERISDKGPRLIGHRGCVYGLPDDTPATAAS